ncbi:MAG: FkbM family methyltransferase [Candidatus Berkelbacteria bacterium]|nr:FkbM family methyltransferase [Candidatus Berkelbacteria bacterium]
MSWKNKIGPKIPVTMVGTLPPSRAISTYCYPLANSLCETVDLDFVDFKRIYPGFLHRGKQLEDKTFALSYSCLFQQRKILTYYNPFSWVSAVYRAKPLVHIQFWSWPILPVLLSIAILTKLTRRKLLVTVHNVLPHEKDFFRFRIFHPLCRPLLNLSDGLVCHSEANKKELLRLYRFKPSKISVIPLGTLDYYKKWHGTGAIKKERGKKYILYFGYIRDYKGLDVLIEAMGEICKLRSDLVLIIAGQPWVRWKPFQNIIDEYKMNANIKLLTKYIPTDKVATVFSSADLVVMPHKLFDGQSGAATLAVTFEKPLVVTDAGGLPDLVVDKRAVAKAGSVESLKKSILWAIENLDRLRKDSSRIKAKNSWIEVGKQTSLLYQNLLWENLKNSQKPWKRNLLSRLRFFLICFWHFSNWWEFIFSRRKLYPKNLKLRSGVKLLLRNRIDYEVVCELIIKRVYFKSNFKLGKGSIVVDIGAHEGVFSLFCAQYSNRVYAFEPDPENYATFEKNLALNSSLKVKLYNLAVASSSGKKKFYSRLDRVSGGLVSWFNPLNSSTKVIEIDSISLENIFRILGNRNIEILKVDCEGAEFEIFRSLPPKYLKKINSIAIEIHETAGSALQLEKKLVESGFKIVKFFRPTISEKIIVAERK